MHAGIEQRRALRMLDQIRRDRQLHLAFPALHQIAEVAGQPAAGHRVELDAHDLLPILQMICAASIRRDMGGSPGSSKRMKASNAPSRGGDLSVSCTKA